MAPALAQSRQPPDHNAKQEQTETSGDRGTPDQPFVVDVVPAPGAAQRAEQEKADRDREAVNDGRNFALTIAIALFAAAQVVMAFISWQTNRAQLRAYVLLDESALIFGNPEGNAREVAVVITLKNFGQTPAFGLSLASNGCFGVPDLGTPKFEAMTPIQNRTSNLLVGPGQTINFPPFKMMLADADVLAMGVAKSRLYAWAVVDYRDAFGVKHQTTVFVRSEGQHGGIWPMAPCKNGNSAS